MKFHFRSACRYLATACLFASTSAASAQVFPLPTRFDFKPSGTATVPGSVAVGEDALFGVYGDYGFSSAPIDARVGENPAHDVIDRGDDDRPLVRGCVRLNSNAQFTCYVTPNQLVRVRVLLAHIPFYWKPGTVKIESFPTALYDISVLASEGTALKTVASDIDLRTYSVKGKLTTEVGSYRKVWFTAKADATGKLRLQFTGPAGAPIPVSAVELYPFVPAPITYKRVGSTWLTSSSGQTIPGLASFHSKDFESASRSFLSISDPLTRANALLWLAGWFESSQDGFTTALDSAVEILASPSLASNPRAIEFRDRISDYRLAERHFALRNYSKASALPPEGFGYFNKDDPTATFAVPPGASGTAPRHLYLAENLYYQVAGSQSLQPITQHNAGSHADARYEVFPLAFRALDKVARLHYTMNSLHSHKAGTSSDPSALAGIERYEALWSEFDSGGFRTNEFSRCAELGLMCWVASPNSHIHSENGGVFENFTGVDVPSSWLDPAYAWWIPQIESPFPNPSTAQPWSTLQREYLRSYRAVLDWWLENRFESGEFGGGTGDDPELIALLAGPLQALRQPDDATRREAFEQSARRVLESDDVVDGYYAGVATDVEHTAEFTSYPIRTGLSLAPNDPYYLRAALEVAKHVTYPSDPSKAWAGSDANGDLRFHAFHFNSFGPPSLGDPVFDTTFVDIPFDGKALLPAFELLTHAPVPAVSAMVSSWARSWREASLETDPARPRGLVPASQTTGLNGPTPASWWLASFGGGPGVNFPANISTLSYVYSGAFVSAYAQGGPNAYEFLVPTVELVKAMVVLQAELDAGQTVSGISTVGHPNWALNQLRLAQSFFENVARMRVAIATNPELWSIDDPYVPGTAPYVDQAFLTSLDALLEKNSGGYLTHLTIPQTGPNPAAGAYSRKGKNGLISDYSRGAAWLRNYFPLATTHALFTDRVFVFHGSSHQSLHGAFTGETLGAEVPRPIVTFETPAQSPDSLDLATLVNDLAVKEGTTNPRLRILLYDFEPVARTVDFRLWDRLPFGRYRMRLGASDPNTDYFSSGFSESIIDFDRSGARFSITLPPQSLQLLELEWFQALSPPTSFDLAVSSSATQAWISGDVTAGFTAHVTSTVFSTALAATPGNTARAYVSLLDPTGVPVLLNGLGDVEVELPIPTNHPPLAAVTGYAMASAPITVSSPLTNDAVALLATGYSLRFRIQVSATGDLYPQNNSAFATTGF